MRPPRHLRYHANMIDHTGVQVSDPRKSRTNMEAIWVRWTMAAALAIGLLLIALRLSDPYNTSPVTVATVDAYRTHITQRRKRHAPPALSNVAPVVVVPPMLSVPTLQVRAMVQAFVDVPQAERPAWLAEQLQQGWDVVDELHTMLRNPHAIAHISPAGDVLNPDQPAVRARHAVFDMLVQIAEADFPVSKQAVAALDDLIGLPVSSAYSRTAQQMLLAEQFDALRVMLRLSPQRARESFAALERPYLIRALQPAMSTLGS